jgi:hypothetical protein
MVRPPIWQLVRGAMQHFNREVSYSELKEFVWGQYPDVNNTTLNCQIITCSVNHPSRIHYAENKRPRVCTSERDFLFHTDTGRVAPYDAEQHGIWEIHQAADGALSVRILQPPVVAPPIKALGDTFPLERYLRDYLAHNLSNNSGFGSKMEVYESEDGRDGIEFQTDVGPIDILATTENGDFHVFELKLSRGQDAALGQILRYMGWVSQHLANGKKVFGVVLAAEISEKLRYAATQVPNVRLMEYEVRFVVRPIEPK